MQITNELAAIVTGGASGLGKASAKALADAGMKVAIFDLNEEAGEAVARDIGGLFCKVNILDEDSVLAGFEKARAAHGQERALIHCAQVSKGGKTVARDRDTGGFKRLSTEDYAFGAQGILIASYRMASISALGMASAEPLNEDGERGAIVLTSSAAAQDGQVGQVAYGSLKAGVNGLVLPMARDLMELGIRVNSVMPGIFATPPMLGVKDTAPQIFENLEKSVPFPKRLGKPEEFGSLIVELVRNSYFNGQNLRIDGAIRMPPR
ncbi:MULTISPECIES: SDR family oxidoreductase [Sphingobium]|jgi:NAD(P)-dependent dehydrogenase (short-subunit alcohol dehydrogenase family)|uniref:SDR family oxidoreductase n=1 Tax=Sphingobium TaxID=165695 RepID=UPI0007F3E0D4|nr:MULTISPECIES: SDR family oxidoreductase [Sphingobium]MBS48927.1 3-hydroxy-2-methylbutyryl-CoA dehydrogenase [Sphingobium sp.]MEC9017306.1 SDR family oxidoreductase [Pseudomonadota bacterium]MCC4256250.1 SDR family oxidoreductase [Sphingobium lactosutens]OAN58225.1 3-hydroxy-2-methylbutyryl-CoA dehydrogenase [Sphingobium sp. TCM1]HCW62048.1 3-hydroxy-2-methylbutyryl-CoA dehydrogenase [Sphingobium sp.]|tara:strand:- start:8767 stop:9561 length:795 start_codon:yes stop_codon:yes gene_type:complete